MRPKKFNSLSENNKCHWMIRHAKDATFSLTVVKRNCIVDYYLIHGCDIVTAWTLKGKLIYMEARDPEPELITDNELEKMFA